MLVVFIMLISTSVTLTPELLEKCKAQHISVSKLIRFLLEQYFKEKEAKERVG